MLCSVPSDEKAHCNAAILASFFRGHFCTSTGIKRVIACNDVCGCSLHGVYRCHVLFCFGRVWLEFRLLLVMFGFDSFPGESNRVTGENASLCGESCVVLEIMRARQQ